MNLELDCPSREQLEAVALGNGSPADSLRVKVHLELCPTCRTVFEELTSSTLAIRGNHAKESRAQTLAGAELPVESPTYAFLLPPVEPDEIGRLGSYRVLRLLGQGGMGIVFQAEDISLRRPVALKVMRPELKGEHDGWKRFLLEARTMAAIKHENLVTIYQAGQEGDVAYFAMELLEGESLESWMKRVPSPDIADILRLGKDIARALAFIHQKGLIHRDIKPANIWLEAPRGQVKILDLGLVRSINADSKLTMSGMILGTPDYMSPEQARGDPLDARSDLFNLGCVLYCLCTGRKPFEAPSFTAVLMALASETPEPAGELNASIPEALSDLVMQLLARNPKKRPASAEEVLKRLDEIEAGVHKQMVRAQPAKPNKKPKPAAKKTRSSDTEVIGRPQRSTDTHARKKNRGKMILAGMVLLGGLGIAAIAGTAAFWLWPRAPRPPLEIEEPIAGEKTFLTDLKDVARENWPFTMDPNGDPKKEKEFKKKGPKEKPPGKEFDKTVRYRGQASPHGIFMHPPVPPHDGEPASLSYDLRKQYQSFHALASINDGQESDSPCTFWVYGDDKLLWKSVPLLKRDDTQKCTVSVKNVNILKIAVTCDGPPRGAHATWVEPYLVK